MSQVLARESEITPSLAINAPKLSMLKRSAKDAESQIRATISVALTKTAITLGYDLNNEIAELACETLVNDLVGSYWHLSIEDILLFFKNCRVGVYGKTFSQKDWHAFNRWLMVYESEQRAEAFERENHNLRNKTEALTGVDFDSLPADTQKAIEKAFGADCYNKEEEYKKYREEYIKQQSKIKTK